MSNFNKLADFLEQSDLFNGNILVAKQDKILFSKSFGFCFDPVDNKALNETSIFELASVSKQFTAMATYLLFVQEKLSLDTEIDEILPNFPYQKVTVQHLLNHTSGLPDYMELFEKYWDKSKIAKNQDVLDLLIKNCPEVYFQPNERFLYSNTGYVILAMILEKLSDDSFENILQNLIFKPLKMDNTFVFNRRTTPKEIKNYAFGVVRDGENDKFVLPDELPEYQAVHYLDGIQGDGTVNSIVLDLLIWNNAILSRKIADDNFFNELFQSTKTVNGEEVEYGFGWLKNDDVEIGKILFHGGSWFGYSTYNSVYFDNGLSIISLCNRPTDLEQEQQIILALENIALNKSFDFPTIKKA